MKYIIIISTLFLTFLIAEENTALIKVEGMSCPVNCVGKVNKVVGDIEGVKDVSVDFEKGIATVVYDDKRLGQKAILAGLEEYTRYKVSYMGEGSPTL
tara:strand:- start:154 stop:447 length:294 start_codon:yes stop_codon:yes gene_type:complete